jgi:hypothetical protein
MLPNFTVVICGAVLTVIMLAVTGSGLIAPETRTRIGEMPEVGRPMMQRMIAEQAGQAQFAVMDLSRRAEELGRLRDLVAPALVVAPAPAVREDDAPKETAPQETAPQETVPQETAQEATGETTREASNAPEAQGDPDTPAAPAPPAIAAAPEPAVVPAPVQAPVALPPAPQKEDGAKAAADPAAAGPRAPADVDSMEAMIPGTQTAPQSMAALAGTEEVAPAFRVDGRLNVRLPRGLRGAKATVLVKRPARHATRRSHRHVRRAYAVRTGPPNPFGLPGTQYR